MKLKIVLFLLIFCKWSPTIAQSNFERSYLQMGMKQYGVSVAELNGKFYVTSLSDDCGSCISTECLTQFDQNGNVLHTNYFSNGTIDEIVGELTPYKSGFIFPVTYDHFNMSNVRKEVAIKYVDSTGTEIWTAIISDSLKEFQNSKLVIGDNNLITGFADNLTSTGVLFFQIDSAGNVTVIQNFSRIPDVYSVRDLVFKNNHFYVLGVGVLNGATKTFVRKVDMSGIVVDSSVYDYATEISGIRIQSSDNGFIICGQSFDTLGFTQVCLMKIDSSGNVVWRKTLTTSNDNIPTSFDIFQNGRIYITGKTIDQSNNVDLFIINADSIGNFLWKRDYCLPGPIGCVASAGNSIIESSDHSVVVCGQVQHTASYPKLYFLKADDNGLINFIDLEVQKNDKPFISKQGTDSYVVNNMSGNFKVTVFDMNGRIIFSCTNTNEFDFRLPEGVYVYRIECKSGIYTGRVF